MKEMFPGFYKRTEEEIKSMWKKGIIFFDANVLLNLHRYSDSTRETLIELISKFSDQICLPHQAALEYNRNRYEVIAEQEKAYKEFQNKITQIQSDLQSVNKPPFLSNKVDTELNGVFERVNNEVKESIEKYFHYLKIDPIYEKLSNLFKNKITGEFSPEELSLIYKEGEERYKLKLPPGFEDEKTKEGNKKFGDLILWKQIINAAKDSKKDVILITDERKIDWWWLLKDGRNMGPRQELVEEIKKIANVEFHMYSSERFLSFGQSILNEKIDQQALNEIQAMKEAEMKVKPFTINIDNYKYDTENKLIDKINNIRNRVEEISEEILFIENKINTLTSISSTEHDNKDFIQNLIIRKSDLEEKRNDLIERLNYTMLFQYNKNKFYNDKNIKIISTWKKLQNDGNKFENDDI